MIKKLIIMGVVAVVVVLAGTYGYSEYMTRTAVVYDVAVVRKGFVIEEAFSSGKVESPMKIDLHFKTSGKLVALYAHIGDKVELGDVLATQDTTQLDTQVAEMDAGIKLQKARLNQLLAGSSREDITVAESTVESATVAVANAERSLENAKQSALDVLTDAYTKSDDAVRNNVDQLFTNARLSNPKLIFSSVNDSQLAADAELSRPQMETVLKSWSKSVLALAADSDLTKQIELAKVNLEKVRIFLSTMAVLINNPNNRPSSISEETWNGWRSSIATSRATISATMSAVSATDENIAAKESAIKAAEANLVTAKKQLGQIKAPTRSTDIAVYQAQIEQALASMKKVEAGIEDLSITSPTMGVVTNTTGEVGEIIDPVTPVVSILSGGNLQIKLNVIEDNIVNVKIGQTARITLDAVSGKEFAGTVTAIDPAETRISGAVYYQTTVAFKTMEDFIRSGMTANVWIKTAQADNTLYIPISAVYERDGMKYVRVLLGKGVTEKAVLAGLKNSNGMIEVTRGLDAGEKVILNSAS